MKKQKFPPGWNEKRVQELIAHYENQTEDEECADIEAARKAEDITLMAIPTDLVPKVRALLAAKGSATRRRDRRVTACTGVPGRLPNRQNSFLRLAL